MGPSNCYVFLDRFLQVSSYYPRSTEPRHPKSARNILQREEGRNPKTQFTHESTEVLGWVEEAVQHDPQLLDIEPIF